jgi:cytochrome c553
MKIKSISLLVFFMLSLVLVSCSHYNQLKADLKESSNGDDESHNTGQNCMSCHNISGSEAANEGGWWTIAGSVYSSANKPQKNATIELWEKPNKQGKLIKRLVSDDKGNFYTNDIINLGSGAYPVVMVGSNSKAMNQAFKGGSCNSCHGVTTNALVIN